MNQKCSRCSSGVVRSYARPGRTLPYKNSTAAIPADFGIPTCRTCSAEFLSGPLLDSLSARLQTDYELGLRKRAAAAIHQVTNTLSQRELERLLGLSQGYVSRLLTGMANPSAALVSLLALLADDCKIHTAWLRRYWLIPSIDESALP